MPFFIAEVVPFFITYLYTCGFYVYVYVCYSFFFRRPQPNCLPVTHPLIYGITLCACNVCAKGSAIKREQIFAWLKDKKLIYAYSKKLFQ